MKKGKYLLRDLKGNTELLILGEFMRNPSVKRKEIAERLDITEQAISQYISNLENNGLLTISAGNPKLTRKGAQLLQERFTDLNEEIKEILRQIRIIDTCVALAGASIEAGQEVGLIMTEGRLLAIPGKRSSSIGISRNSAEKGEELLVGNLSGLVKMNLGKLLVLQIPSEIAGGSRKIDSAIAKRAIREFKSDQISAGDLVGEIAAKKLGLRPTIVLAPTQASMNALSKGLNVLFLGTRESIEEILRSVEELRKKTGYLIEFRLIDIGKAN